MDNTVNNTITNSAVSQPRVNQRLNRLEAVRGLAAFYVVLHHTINHNTVLNGVPVGFLLRFGQEAVILFFLLSGFVINYSFRHSSDRSFSNYFFKRSTRIYIPLFFVFLISYAGQSYIQGELINPQLWTLLKNILMLQDWDVVKPNVLAEPYMGNTPLWSLSYEWWFYMLYFPIVTRIGSGSVFRQSMFVFGLSILMAALYVWQPNFLFRLFAYFGVWWAGVYLSDLYLDGKHTSFKSLSIPVLAVAAIAAVMFVPVLMARQAVEGLLLGKHPLLEFRHVFTALFFIVGGIVWCRLRWFGFDTLIKPFLIFAPISYVLYICHQPLMVQATYLDFIEHSVLRWFSYLFVVLLFSYILELKIYPLLRSYFRARRVRA